jgi:hypothetical protein
LDQLAVEDASPAEELIALEGRLNDIIGWRANLSPPLPRVNCGDDFAPSNSEATQGYPLLVSITVAMRGFTPSQAERAASSARASLSAQAPPY